MLVIGLALLRRVAHRGRASCTASGRSPGCSPSPGMTRRERAVGERPRSAALVPAAPARPRARDPADGDPDQRLPDALVLPHVGGVRNGFVADRRRVRSPARSSAGSVLREGPQHEPRRPTSRSASRRSATGASGGSRSAARSLLAPQLCVVRLRRALPARAPRPLAGRGGRRARRHAGARDRRPDQRGPLVRRAREPARAAARDRARGRRRSSIVDDGAARRAARRCSLPVLVVAGALAMSWNSLSFAAALELAGRGRSGSAIGLQQTVLNLPVDRPTPALFGALVAASLLAGRLRGRRALPARRAGGCCEHCPDERVTRAPRRRSTRSRSTAPAYSPEEDAAHELAAGWMREAGLEVSRDDAGNLFGTRGDARVWAGSHLDSVPTAGKFDGALGVVAAIEAAARLRDAPLAVVAFRAEETGPMGSKQHRRRRPTPTSSCTSSKGPCSRASASRSASSRRSRARRAATRSSRGAPTTRGRRRWTRARTRSSRRRGSSSTCASARAAGTVATVGAIEVEPNATNVVPARVDRRGRCALRRRGSCSTR